MKRVDIVELFTRLREINPHPKTELTYSTPFELLVSVVLSAQATDVGVNKATRKLYPVANTPATILALGEEKLKKMTSARSVFLTGKAKNVIALSRILLEQYDSEVPRTREALKRYPAWVVKRPMSYSTQHSASRRWLSTRIFFAFPIAPAWHREKMCARSRTNWKKWCRRSSSTTRITGSSCMAAMSAKHASPTVPQCVIRDLCRYRDIKRQRLEIYV